MERRSASGLEILGAMLLGAAGGFALGLLLAPQSGSRTREQLAENLGDVSLRASELAENVKGNTESLINTTRTTIEEKLNLLSEAVEAGRKAAAYKREELIEGEEPSPGEA
jgi:gas vesicle protein